MGVPSDSLSQKGMQNGVPEICNERKKKRTTERLKERLCPQFGCKSPEPRHHTTYVSMDVRRAVADPLLHVWGTSQVLPALFIRPLVA